MSFYHKYRPQTIEEFVAPKPVKELVVNFIADPNRPRVYLLTGPTGCGKTTLARIIAEGVGATVTNIRELNSANFRGIDTIRDITEATKYKALDGKPKVWIIDEVHRMTKDAQEASLKLLEDSHESCYFILATTEPGQLLPAIRSRCINITVSPLQEKDCYLLLDRINKGENYEMPETIFQLIMEKSEGRPREAIQLLEACLYSSTDEDAKKVIQDWTGENQSPEVFELCRLLANPKTKWATVADFLTRVVFDPEPTRRMILSYFAQVILKNNNPTKIRESVWISQCFSENFYDSGKNGFILACWLSVTKEGTL